MVLCGCQTANRYFPSSPSNGIKLSVGKSGSVKVSMNRTVARETRELTKILSQSLSGEHKSGTSMALVYPRSNSYPLGTVLRLPSGEGQPFNFDSSQAESLQGDIQTSLINSALLAGLMNETSRHMLLSPQKRHELYARLIGPNVKGYAQMSTVANVKGARVQALPEYFSRQLSRKHLKTLPSDGKSYYFIADKLVWAKEISYFIGPNQIWDKPSVKGPRLEFTKTEIESAKSNNVDIKNVNGITVITETFDTEKVVAVGFSIFPELSKRGDLAIKNGHQPTLAEIYLSKSEPANLMN